MAILHNDTVANLITLIDVCASRGAIQGNELLTVGNMRQELEDYLNQERDATTEEPPQN